MPTFLTGYQNLQLSLNESVHSIIDQLNQHNYEVSVTSPWASYQIRKIAGCACAGNAGNVFPRRRFQRKPIVSDPGMHHGTCVTHVPWCMSGSFTCGDGENVPGIPGACAPAILRIWQEAHCNILTHITIPGPSNVNLFTPRFEYKNIRKIWTIGMLFVLIQNEYYKVTFGISYFFMQDTYTVH